MEELKEFFKDVKRIADGIEAIANDVKKERTVERAVETACNCLTTQYEQCKQEHQPVPQQAQAPIQQATVQIPVQQSVQQVPVQTAIPVSNTVQSYTQEQLAVAMGRAVDSGKQSQILAIISSFGVSSLMELPQERYNDLALKLKEIGVDV